MARSALIAPGGGYGPQAPLLAYACAAVERRDTSTTAVTWKPTSHTLSDEDFARWACEQVAAQFDRHDLLIGKSLGTTAAPIAADYDVPAIWLTPLLTEPWVSDALRRASAPFLLVGGTADKLWDGDVARSLTPYVLEVTGADHGMMLDGPLARSADVLGQVATAVEQFLDTVVWPSP